MQTFKDPSWQQVNTETASSLAHHQSCCLIYEVLHVSALNTVSSCNMFLSALVFCVWSLLFLTGFVGARVSSQTPKTRKDQVKMRISISWKRICRWFIPVKNMTLDLFCWINKYVKHLFSLLYLWVGHQIKADMDDLFWAACFTRWLQFIQSWQIRNIIRIKHWKWFENWCLAYIQFNICKQNK